MASTKNKPAFTAATPDWMSRIKESSHDVLLAGIGALARARKDGAKPAKGGKSAKSTGADFETLVSEGRKLEPEVKDSLQKVWTDLKEKSRTSMPFKPDGKLKGVFEQRVAEALARLGVPRAKEIEDLNRKVDSLLAKRDAGAKASAKKALAKRRRQRRWLPVRPRPRRRQQRRSLSRRLRPRRLRPRGPRPTRTRPCNLPPSDHGRARRISQTASRGRVHLRALAPTPRCRTSLLRWSTSTSTRRDCSP